MQYFSPFIVQLMFSNEIENDLLKSDNWLVVWMFEWVSRMTKVTQQATADSRVTAPKDCPEICHHNYDPPWRG